ncbi:MAG: oligosaccharide flippase family protein [Bacteroidetes bacterium]|jgi:O-antigen/teichoic acid export membrane protein|nr:oligosaccharide flippase family protein [Bacteroidota bacterium]MBT4408285.1 oligosaccharide flippase family protein [Bacteroidota bacterium]
MGIKTKISQILKSDNSISLIGNMVFAFFGFANIFILARSYPKDVFGEWVLYLSGMALFEMIRKGITGTPLVRFVAGTEDETERNRIIGAGWVLSVAVTIAVIVILVPSYMLFSDAIDEKGFGLFFKWYPLLAVVVLPLNTGLSILQADRRFTAILQLRFVNMFVFFLFLILNWLWLKLPIVTVVWCHIGSQLLASIFAVSKKWSGIKTIVKATSKSLKAQFNFGKYSLGTLIGSNLLKSSDTFIIGIMLAEPQVAYYSIPLKLIEIVEIPMRSFVAVAFPKMSKASRNGNVAEVRSIFYQYAGVVSWLFIGLVLALFVMAKPLTLILGGPDYVESALIFKIFLIYALFLPLDRFSGITLDAINRPKLNMIKVIFMASANIIGDILAIHFFKSLEAVAMITIINVLTGVIVGNWFLRREIQINALQVFPAGLKHLRSFVNQILK